LHVLIKINVFTAFIPHEYVCYHIMTFNEVGSFALRHYHTWSFIIFILCMWIS